MKSILVIVVLLAFNTQLLHAQDTAFEETVNFIQQKVSCCSVPFSPSTNRKVDSIAIAENGDITIGYSDDKPLQTFNIFELYKETEGATGIDTVMGGKFIQFYVSAEKIRLVRFATAADARETYAAFLKLFSLCKKQSGMFGDLEFKQTVDAINTWLAIWSEEGKPITVSAWENGEVNIAIGRNQSFRFNFFDLADTDATYNKMGKPGIEIVPCDVKTHAPIAWIRFNTVKQRAAFIRIDCYTPAAQLAIIREAFTHLKSLCTNDQTFDDRPAGVMYFISRNTFIKTENEILLTSIRSIDKKDEEDTTLTVSASGEGWLDKDSLPIGKWNFYAKDKQGKEWLFKSGTYRRTNAEIFEVMNIDSANLAKSYRLSFRTLQQRHITTIPFIKINNWNYYHANGKLWKSVNYQVRQIPINTSFGMADPANDASTTLMIQLKENPDEWIDTEVIEYNEEGKLYKKLKYYGFSEVYQKTLYNKIGEIIKTETAKPYEKQVLPNNY